MNLNNFKIGDTIMRINYTMYLEVAKILKVTQKNIILRRGSFREYHGDLSNWVLYNKEKAEKIEEELDDIRNQINVLSQTAQELLR